MQHWNKALMAAVFVAATAAPAMADERDPLATAAEHASGLPVDISIDIIRSAGDVSGSIDVSVDSPGVTRSTEVTLPPLRGHDASVAADASADHATPPTGEPGVDRPGFDTPVGPGAEGEHPGFDTPVSPEPGTDHPDFEVPVGTAAGGPGDVPPAVVPDDVIPAAVPDGVTPTDVPSGVVPTDLPDGVTPGTVPTDVIPSAVPDGAIPSGVGR
jgi:hypothetical protein